MSRDEDLAAALKSAELFVDGDWVESKDQDPEGDVRLVQLADIGDGRYLDKSARFLTSQKARDLRCTLLCPGDVLVARMPDPLGRACVYPGGPTPSVTAVDVCIIRPNARNHEARWLMHYLNTAGCRQQIASYATGTTRRRISRSNLGRVKVSVPPLVEQRRIAEVLDRAEVLRAKRRAALVQLDTLTQAIFLDVFGDPLTNPKGIQTEKLASLCTRITDGTHQPPTWSDAGHPFLFVSNIVTGEIHFETTKFISDETHAELTRRCPIEVGDVLYSTVGSYGVPALVRGSRKFAFQRHIAHLKPDPTLLDSEFLCAMLASPPLRRQADRAARGVAQKTVNLAEIRNFVVFHPPLPAQRDFARRVAAVKKLKTSHRASLAELGALFTVLQHRAFRGEL